MEAVRLLESINNHYCTAVSFHKEMADIYRFMSFPGFSALHEYQALDESITQRKVKHWIIDKYYVAVYDKIEGEPEDNEFRKFSDGKSRFSITPSDKWTFLQDSWADYRNWEKKTLELYQPIAKELMENGYVSDSNFVSELVGDVSNELSELVDIMLALQGMEYDIPTITSMQLNLKHNYQKNIKELYKKTDLGGV